STVQDGITAAGSVSLNLVVDTTTAYVDGVQASLVGDSSVKASDQTAFWALAGSVAFGGKAGFGVAVAANLVGFSTQTDLVPNLPCSTLAYVRNSQITLGGGTLEVSALDANSSSLPRYVTAAGSLGWGMQQSSTGVGGMVTVTIADGQTASYLQGSQLTD